MSDRQEVLIVGAGPTGLMAACQLALFGIKFRIIDKNTGPALESRALAVQARTLEIFSLMGIADEAVARGKIIKKIEPHPFGHRLSIRFNCLINETPYPFILILEQNVTESILEKKLNSFGIYVEREKELLTYTQSDGTVTSAIKNLKTNELEECESEFLLGADGAHSNVRKGLDVEFLGGDYPQDFWLADLSMEGEIKEDRITVFLRATRILGIFPLHDPHHFRLVGRATKKMQKTTNIKEIEHYVKKITGRKIHCHQPRWVAVFRLHHRLVNKMRVGSVFLLGDAAHIHSPVGGQGMNTGIQDAFNLCWKLSYVLKRKMDVKVLQTYHDERHPVGLFLLQNSDRAFRLLASGSYLEGFFKFIIFGLVSLALKIYPKLANGLIWFVSQLKIKYKKGWFFPGKNAVKPTAGERAPWCEVINTMTKEKLSLFSFFHNTKHHLLVFAREITEQHASAIHHQITNENIGVDIVTESFSVPGTFQDITGKLFNDYGVETDYAFVFVRPDGYIAWRRESFAFDEFNEFLQEYFV